MPTDAFEMGTAFSDWQVLSLAYEAGIEALRQHQPGAAEALMKISRELQTCEGANAEKRNAAERG